MNWIIQFCLARHCIEAYLKALLKNPPEHHDLSELIRLLANQRGRAVAAWVMARLWDFHRIDKLSDTFRYAGDPGGELWVDFHHLRAIMEELKNAFEGELKHNRDLAGIPN